MRQIAILAFLVWSVPASVIAQQRTGNTETAGMAAQFCIDWYFDDPVQSTAFLAAGFQEKTWGYKRSRSVLGLAGHSDKSRVKFGKDECYYSYGTNRSAELAISSYVDVLLKNGFQKAQYKTRRNLIPVYVKGNLVLYLSAKSGHANGAFFTNIRVMPQGN